jgi:hypothetical protein
MRMEGEQWEREEGRVPERGHSRRASLSAQAGERFGGSRKWRERAPSESPAWENPALHWGSGGRSERKEKHIHCPIPKGYAFV